MDFNLFQKSLKTAKKDLTPEFPSYIDIDWENSIPTFSDILGGIPIGQYRTHVLGEWTNVENTERDVNR